MAHAHCAHCRRTYQPDPDGIRGLCHDCADFAVWGAPCEECGEVPTGRERKPCGG